MADIIPRRKTEGVDFCGSKDCSYIIRSDLGCYMRSSDLNKGSDLGIHALHPSCRNGDHYFTHKEEIYTLKFYIIKGDDYRTVTDLTEDTGSSSVFTLHPNCRGGDHYLSAFGSFYIIFQKKGIYRKTEDLSKDSYSDYTLLDNCKDGLYYWGLPDNFYFLKPTSKWGVQYYERTDLNTNVPTAVLSVHPSVLNFLPGGLSITKGPSFGKWVNIINVDNDSPTPLTLQRKMTKKVGYNKEKMSQITDNWRTAASATISTGKLTELITQCQFSLLAEYGGARVNAEKEYWNEETVVEEQLTFELKPKQRLYVWQYQLGLGSEPVLFCPDLKITDQPDPPTEVNTSTLTS